MTQWIFNDHISLQQLSEGRLPFVYDGGDEFPEWLQHAHEGAPARFRGRLHPIWIQLLGLAALNDPLHGFLHEDLIRRWTEELPAESQDVYACLDLFTEYGGVSPVQDGWQITDWKLKFRPTPAQAVIQAELVSDPEVIGNGESQQ